MIGRGNQLTQMLNSMQGPPKIILTWPHAVYLACVCVRVCVSECVCLSVCVCVRVCVSLLQAEGRGVQVQVFYLSGAQNNTRLDWALQFLNTRQRKHLCVCMCVPGEDTAVPGRTESEGR